MLRRRTDDRYLTVSRWFYRLIGRPPRLLYALGLGRLIGRRVLLLSTKGRRTGKLRTTPLQYERVDGAIWIGSARGTGADWYRNLVVHPQVEVRVGRSRFPALAETTTDVAAVADFLAMRLRRHPFMMGAMLWAAGVGLRPSRTALEEYGGRLALVVLHPQRPRQAASQ